LCLRVAIEELMRKSWSGGARRYRVADVVKVVTLNGGVLTSDMDGGVSGEKGSPVSVRSPVTRTE
jgi:hypothetical protein